MLKGLRLNAESNIVAIPRAGVGILGVPNAGASATAQTKEAAFDYLWTPPAWKPTLTVGANYTRRFEKYQIRFQPNVTYLLNELDPI